MELFIEPAEHAIATAVALRTAVEAERACCLVTVLSSSAAGVVPGARHLRLADGTSADGLGTDAA
ncbi:hypothetical protein, partial [Salmonella enterica]|uniref:hypothetical protein n=1 Tax=Salmonella enterica TaxID=28901 RepID=UPI0015CCE398